MKTELIFFDSFENSMKGTERGLIAFISLILFDMIWLKITKNSNFSTKVPYNIYSALLVWLLLASALAVQRPKSYFEALVYGALVGLVVYGIFNLTNFTILKEWSLSNVITNTIWGILNCSIASSLIYLLTNSYH